MSEGTSNKRGYTILKKNGATLEGITEVPVDEQKGDETNRKIDKSEL